MIQVSELFIKDGKMVCDRNAKVIPPDNIFPENGEWGQKNYIFQFNQILDLIYQFTAFEHILRKKILVN